MKILVVDANREERIQAMESVLELPRSVGRFVRVPNHDELPPGPLAARPVGHHAAGRPASAAGAGHRGSARRAAEVRRV